MTKQTKWHVRPAKTQISLGIRPVWSESSLCAQWVAKEPSFLHADSEDSDQTGLMAQAGLSLRWAHMPFCWFCHEAAQFITSSPCDFHVFSSSPYDLKVYQTAWRNMKTTMMSFSFIRSLPMIITTPTMTMWRVRWRHIHRMNQVCLNSGMMADTDIIVRSRVNIYSYAFALTWGSTLRYQKLVNFPEIPIDLYILWSTGKRLLCCIAWTVLNKNYASGKLVKSAIKYIFYCKK